MHLLLQILANGVLLGGLYALMALGLALVWGVLNIVNLAHGSFIMLGAYSGYYLFTKLGIDPFMALPISMLALFCTGFLIQRNILNLIVRAPMFNTLLITFGIDVVLTYLAQMFFSADFRTTNPSYAGDHFNWLGMTLPLVRVLACGIALALTVALWLFLGRTRLGRAIRATAQNLGASRLYGVEPRLIYALTFG
jgi:Branched-chain amino acid ABC-type transport system, permease components